MALVSHSINGDRSQKHTLLPHQQHCNELILTYFLFSTYSHLFSLHSRPEEPKFFFQLILMTLVAKEGTSKGYFERVMINKFVDIEGGIEVKDVRVVDFPIDRCV